jgi:hypothetical protein
MTWATPKTDWNVDYVPDCDDLNRIEENIRLAGLNLGHGAVIQNIASGSNLDITITTDIFYITGNTQIDYIKTAERYAGSKIYLVFEGALTIKNSQGSAGSGYAKIVFIAGDILTATDEVKCFIFDGIQWRWLTDKY